jgi:hypothetical protein
MLAGVRNVAFGAAIVMAGMLAVMMAERAWAVLFLLSDGPPPLFDGDDGIGSTGYTESLIGVAVMIWLVGRMVRRALKSIEAGR